jgi:hypothetical protein
MDLHTLCNQAVLSTLVGPISAAKLLQNTGGSLAPLIGESVATYRPDRAAMARLVAARELVRRGLEEELREQCVLSLTLTFGTTKLQKTNEIRSISAPVWHYIFCRAIGFEASFVLRIQTVV